VDWKDDEEMLAFLREEASWRKMLFLQPPPKVLTVTRFAREDTSIGDTEVSFENSASGGVAMGMVYDLTESFVSECVPAAFFLAVSESEQGPRLTLYLLDSSEDPSLPTEYQDPYIPLSFPRMEGTRSRGAEVQVKDLAFVLRKKEDCTSREDMNWESALSTEKGGMDYEALFRWCGL
jgi:hypothetical protein